MDRAPPCQAQFGINLYKLFPSLGIFEMILLKLKHNHQDLPKPNKSSQHNKLIY